MTINIIETMKQALEAIEDLGMKHFAETGEVLYKDVYDNLRAAIDAAEKQEPVAWCVAYDDPRMGRIHSSPSMCEPQVDAHVAKCEERIVKVPLYTHPASAVPCPKCEEAADKALKYATKYEELVQAITDPENQPSQYGTVLMSNAPALPEDAAKDATEKQEPVRQYYYKVSGCSAESAHDPSCVCWHDEGSGPLRKMLDDTYIVDLEWRNHPAPTQSDSAQAKDAARYRWLRDSNCTGLTYVGGDCLAEELLDAAIDAAMKVGAGTTGETK